MWISNESREPAQTTSPLGSTAKQDQDNRVGAVKVRKFRYLIKSHALMDPSRLDCEKDVASFRKLASSNSAGMFCKSHDAEPRIDIPDFDLSHHPQL